MTDCPFTINADGLYQCPDCDWVYPLHADKPPHRNCPKSPDTNTPEHRERIKQKMLAELRPVIDDLSAITEQLDQCLTPCKEFDGRTCTSRGSDCKKWTRWKEFLTLSTEPCLYFEA